jgi:SAM-dependent methyltransferase
LASHRWRTAENSAAYLLDDITPSAAVLDIGCGPGTVTVDFARLASEGQVVGLDVEETVLEEARQVAFDAGVHNVQFDSGSVYALEFPDDAFDVVHAHQVMQHLGDPVAALREMRRVCKPTGVVAARDADFGAMTWFPANPGLDRWQALSRDLAVANGGQADGGRHLASWASQAGFSTVRSTASAWCFADPAARAWWGGSWSRRVIDSDFARGAVLHGLATRADLQALASAWLDWEEAEDGWFAVLHGEVRCTP